MPSLAALLSPLAEPRAWLQAALTAVVPPACSACRAPLGDPVGALCASCRSALPWLRGGRCARCGLPTPCGRRCPLAGGAIDRAWAPLAHEGPARAVVHAVKLRGALGLLDLMAAPMVAGAPDGLLDAPAVLVPVPAVAARRRRRGFDHAERLAEAIAGRIERPVVRCLTRSGPASRQVGATRRERLAPERLVVTARAPAPAIAVLIDDVRTTGATLQTCARALRAAGATEVRALTYVCALR